jgi:hypothetical protein
MREHPIRLISFFSKTKAKQKNANSQESTTVIYQNTFKIEVNAFQVSVI